MEMLLPDAKKSRGGSNFFYIFVEVSRCRCIEPSSNLPLEKAGTVVSSVSFRVGFSDTERRKEDENQAFPANEDQY
jgi:hypothetical protein